LHYYLFDKEINTCYTLW